MSDTEIENQGDTASTEMENDPSENEAQNLSDVLEEVKEKTAGEKVSVDELLDSIKHRGFGPLLMVPAIIVISPIGAIPGMPIVTGLLIFLIAIQMLFGRKRPWLPKRLLKFQFSKNTQDGGIDKILPWVKRFEKVIHQRFAFLAGPPFIQGVAVLCVILSLSFIPLGLIPFAVMIPGFAIAFMALGVTAKDGLLILFGIGCTFGAGWMTYSFWPF